MATAAAITPTKFDSVFDCPRCDGKGCIPEFRHIAGGRCFLCAGNKTINMKVKTVKVVEKKTQVVFRSCEVYQAIDIWMTGRFGLEVVYSRYITNENREELRALWAWFKSNGAEMVIQNS